MILELANEIQSAQKALDIICLNENSVVYRITNCLDKYVDCLNEINPININFDKKGFINNMRVKSYWEKFNTLQPVLINLSTQLNNNQNTIKNSLITLKEIQSKLNKVIECTQTAISNPASDEEIVTELLVAKGLNETLKNNIEELEILREKSQKVIKISKPLLDNSIITSKNQYREFNRACSSLNK